MSENSDNIWNDWNKTGGPRYPHEKVIQYIFRNFPQRDNRIEKRAFDLGCGSGVNTLFLAREGFETYASDISEIGVRNTEQKLEKEKLTATVKLGSVESINWPSNHFDVLICVSVLECVSYEIFQRSLIEINRVLKQGGKGLILFASDLDFRITDTNISELGLKGYSDVEVSKAFSNVKHKFSKINLDHYITTHNNNQIQQNDHLITFIK